MNVFLGAVVGCIIGYVVAWIVRPPPKFFNFTVIMIGIGEHPSTAAVNVLIRVMWPDKSFTSYYPVVQGTLAIYLLFL